MVVASLVLALALRGFAGPWETFRAGGQGPMWIGALLGVPAIQVDHREGYSSCSGG